MGLNGNLAFCSVGKHTYIIIARSTSLTINQQINMKEEICLSRKAVSIEQNFSGKRVPE